jgi:hypothetical protein
MPASLRISVIQGATLRFRALSGKFLLRIGDLGNPQIVRPRGVAVIEGKEFGPPLYLAPRP